MWVFCGGMFRSASTLQFQITARLVTEAGSGQPIGWIDAERFAETRQQYTDQSGLKIIKVHVCPEPIQAEFWQNNALGLYISRDIRDVFASYLKQRHKSFEFLWQEDFLATCLDSYEVWTTLPNMLISTYQQVMDNLPREVNRIAQHLGIDISPAECQAIAADYSLESQQQRVQRFRKQLTQTKLNPDDHRELVDYHDDQTLLHINHIDSAKRDRWRSDLTPEAAAAIEQGVADWCDRHGYSPSLFIHQPQYI